MSLSKGNFLTATGILMTLLFVWAQLWVSAAQAEGYKGNTLTLGYGLAWIFEAIFVSAIAFLWTLWTDEVSSIAKKLVLFALLLAVIEVAASLFGVWMKMFADGSILRPLEDGDLSLFGLEGLKVMTWLTYDWIKAIIMLTPLATIFLFLGWPWRTRLVNLVRYRLALTR